MTRVSSVDEDDAKGIELCMRVTDAGYTDTMVRAVKLRMRLRGVADASTVARMAGCLLRS
jgi:hypothetical protein